MKKILQIFVVIFILTGVALGAWYAGGVTLAVILGVLGLTGLMAISFLLGSHWTYRLLREGARLAIDSRAGGEQAEAVQTKALANLMTETVKHFKPSGTAAMEPPKYPAISPLLPASTSRPPLLSDSVGPPFGFTIAGLDDDEPADNF